MHVFVAGVSNLHSNSHLSSEDLKNLGRELDAPFIVELESDKGVNELFCEKMLRCLPGKRLVVLANYNGDQVVAKIFLGRNGQRNFKREKSGVTALHNANLNTPEIIAEGIIAGGASVIVFRYLAEAISLEKLWSEAADMQARSSLLSRSLGCIALMHEAGIAQQDIHLGNFLYQHGSISIIDGAAVLDYSANGPLGERDSIDNLAAFFCEFAPKYESLIASSLSVYEKARPLPPRTGWLDILVPGLRAKRHYRKQKYLTKIFRDCTQFHCESGFDRFLVSARQDSGEEFDKLLKDPETAISSGRALKEGNTATVVEVKADGRMLVVKRYNIKNFFHGLRKALFTSRARRSWYNAHLMQLYEIPGARPVALLEKRWGPVCLTSYYITESVPGPNAREYFLRESYSEEDIISLVEIVRELQRCNIRHGDLKATNFIMADPVPVLIDLDSMREYTQVADFLKVKERDMERFLVNWQADRKLHGSFLQAFNDIQNSQPWSANQLE